MSQRLRRGAAGLFAAAALTASLSACSSDSGSDTPGRDTAAAAGETAGGSGSKTSGNTGGKTDGKKTAALRLDDGTRHVFELETCILSSDEALAAGPNKQLPAWFDLDLVNNLTAGGMRIDLGTDKKFSSTDELIVLQEFDKGRYVAPAGREILTLEGTVTMPDDSKQGGVLTVECER